MEQNAKEKKIRKQRAKFVVSKQKIFNVWIF